MTRNISIFSHVFILWKRCEIMKDVIIIGAGISGTFVARELSKYNLDILVIDKHNDIANETTMANSAIIHSGLDPIPGSLKAKLNVKGNKMYPAICEELNVEFNNAGSINVATTEEELTKLKALQENAEKNGVEVIWWNQEEVRAHEPNISEHVLAGLFAPSAGIIYPWELALALMDNAMTNGVELALNEEVTAIKKDKVFTVTTNKSEYQTKTVINASGVYADVIRNMVCEPKYKINPRRGQYFVLDKSEKGLVKSVIFPLPTDKGKGVLVVPTTHDNILVGPDSVFVDDRSDTMTSQEGMDYVRQNAGNIVKNVPLNRVIRSFSGLRAASDLHDFIIEEDEKVKGFVDVAGIESPGLASAPAIAELVVDIVKEILNPKENEEFIKYKPTTLIANLSREDLIKRMDEDKSYTKVICRCEVITEGEIVAAIKGNVGAQSVKGVKKRCRPGMGLCQGGFCEPEVVKILARELGISPLEVPLDSPKSNILVEETKVGAK